jgi:hypothetical protein
MYQLNSIAHGDKNTYRYCHKNNKVNNMMPVLLAVIAVMLTHLGNIILGKPTVAAITLARAVFYICPATYTFITIMKAIAIQIRILFFHDFAGVG